MGTAWSQGRTAWSPLGIQAAPPGQRSVPPRNVSPAQELGRMNAVQAILLAVSAAVFIYLGIAMFKPEWF